MGVRVALLVLTGFAVAWVWAALRLSAASPRLIILPIAISLALLAWGWRGSIFFQSRGPHVGKVVAFWSAIEFAALLLTANVVQNLHRGDLMLPLGAIIVGLHFFPLARSIPVRLYYATACGLVMVGLAALLLTGVERQMVAGLGSALVLWATAAVIGLQGRRATAARQLS